MTIRIWGKDIIVLNTAEAVAEVLETRTGATWGRPRMVMAHELAGFADVPSQTNDPSLHKRYRRAYAATISARGAQRYWGVQELELRRAALGMLDVKGSEGEAVRRAVAAIVLQVAYGHPISSTADPLIARANEILRIFEKVMQPGVWLVDIFPLLKHFPSWFPGAGFKRRARTWRARIRETRVLPFERVKRDMEQGRARASVSSQMLEQLALSRQAGLGLGEREGERKDEGRSGGEREGKIEGESGEESAYDEEFIMATAGSFYSAGSDTSVAAIQTFLCAMALHPHCQSLAQAELDTLTSRSRLPALSDRPLLPYCAAIVQETLRWHPVTPFALPHVLLEDVSFRRWRLPRGRAVLGNVWSITRDEGAYPKAGEFRPERWLDEEGMLRGVEKEKDGSRHLPWTFGFGRRVCPGSVLAEATLFAAVVSILWSCTVSRLEGTEAREVEWEEVGVHRPKDFPLDVRERFEGAAEILRGAVVE
ncbi:cytochrome P450 [Calocera cornea HHB12733]|uniref:Cytochrome P450 n=1 Tax=Calocera cornea HHB12733 TaxID=1353952 RepID=A0A165GUI9_9BASI|nr:cytochrome P450 [Calocera cornea HHB12733]